MKLFRFMSKEELEKACTLNKEELIEWLNEVYQDNYILNEIIDKYEEYVQPYIHTETRYIDDIKTLEKKVIIYTEVKVSNNFIYRKYNKK